MRKAQAASEKRIREHKQIASEALAKLRFLEEQRASESRMLEQFRKQERERKEEEERIAMENLSARQMQRLARGKRARKAFEETKRMRQDAAIVLTYALRVRISKRKLWEKKEVARRCEEENSAALLLQLAERRRGARKEFNKRRAAKKQRDLEEHEKWMKNEAAGLLQRQMRGREGRKMAKMRKIEIEIQRKDEAARQLEDEAAKLLQRQVRGREGRRLAKKKRAEAAEKSSMELMQDEKKLESILMHAAPSSPPQKLGEILMDAASPPQLGAMLSDAADGISLNEEHAAAQTLQNRARVHLAKRQLSERRSAFDLQRQLEAEYERERLEERRFKLAEQNYAAARLQAKVRSNLAKKDFDRKIAERRGEVIRENEKIRRDIAATKLQGKVRVRSAKKELSRRKREIEREGVEDAVKEDSIPDEEAQVEVRNFGNERTASPYKSDPWISVVDPDSRLTYYYNTKTMQSSWDIPESCVNKVMPLWRKNEDEGWVPQSDPIGTPSKIMPSPDRVTSKDPAEAGKWQLRRTESKVRTMLNNFVTQSLLLSRLLSLTHHKQTLCTLANILTNQRKCQIVLKEKNWVEYYDEERSLPFYYNIITGDSTWAKPVEVGGNIGREREISSRDHGKARLRADSAHDKEEGDDNVFNKEGDCGKDDHGSEKENDRRDDGGGNGSDGDNYDDDDFDDDDDYHDGRDREKSEANNNDDAGGNNFEGEGGGGGGGGGGQGRQSLETEEETPAKWELKRQGSVREMTNASSGWSKYKDPSTNATFYYNEKTGESSWDAPDDFPNEDGWDSRRRNSVRKKGVGDWVQYEGKSLTNERVKEGKRKEKKRREEKSVKIQLTLAKDPAYNNAPFWYNEKTGESVWEKPDGFGDDDDDDDDDDENDNYGNDNLGRMNRSAFKKSDGMSGLEDFLNEVATNIDTPMTESPKKSNDAKQEEVQAEREREEHASPGGKGIGRDKSPINDWETHLDHDTKTVYYYNRVTHESSWEKPDVLKTAPIKKKSVVGPTSVKKSLMDDMNAEEDKEEAASDVEWQEFTDKSSGRKYYFNAATKESRWDSLENAGGNNGHNGESSGTTRQARASFEGKRGGVGANPIFVSRKIAAKAKVEGDTGADEDASLYSSDSSYSLTMDATYSNVGRIK